jgi:hypothetical protein
MADRPSEEHKPGRENSEGTKARLVGFFQSYGRALTASAGVLGGLFYILLTWTSSFVYHPVGVRPGEVGLGYGVLLVGTAATLVVALAVVLAGVCVAFLAMWLRQKTTLGYVLACVAVVAVCVLALAVNDIAGFFLALLLPLALVAAYLFPEHAYRLVAGVGFFIVLVVAFVTVGIDATEARSDIKDGSTRTPIEDVAASSTPFPLLNFNIWEGRIADVHTSESQICGLYLGEADGIGVLEVEGETPGKLVTMRFPLASSTLEIHPDRSTC